MKKKNVKLLKERVALLEEAYKIVCNDSDIFFQEMMKAKEDKWKLEQQLKSKSTS